MHTEHLRNVHPMWIVSGWLVAIALSSLGALVVISLDLMGPAANAQWSEALWAVIIVAVGFFLGGFSIGYRAVAAPILHGLGIGIASVVAWLPLNVLIDAIFDVGPWEALTPRLAVTLLLVQMVAAVGGTWLGYRLTMRGAPAPAAGSASDQAHNGG